MLNRSARKEAEEKLKKSLKKHEAHRQEVKQACEQLFEQRQRAINEVIEPLEDYVYQLAYSPKEFEWSVRELRIEIDRFKRTVRRIEIEIDQIEMEARKSEKVAGAAGVAGAMAGAGLAIFGETAAIALATTFGTASTGTAISALYGAAWVNATLAWLGGGAIAAGGGGMLAGRALLNLFGPVGWTISGLSTAGSLLHLRHRNHKATEEANQKRSKVDEHIPKLQEANREIRKLETSTKTLIEGTLAVLGWLSKNAPNDYQQFTPGQKDRLADIVNYIRSLSELFRKEITP